MTDKKTVFPARAGMSRRDIRRNVKRNCVPRASGDEPETEDGSGIFEGCSPRERG